MQHYSKLKGLEFLYFEDSFVLGIKEESKKIIFSLDVVLLEKHPQYSPPKEGEAYCFKRGDLVFGEVTKSTIKKSGAPPAIDASGAKDLGNIDVFFKKDGKFFIEGDWGTAEIESDEVSFYFSE